MRKLNFSAVVMAVLMMACGGAPSPQEPREPQAGEGVVQLPLITTSADGQRYRLVGATFAITGTQSATITDTSLDTVSVPLPAGNYSIRLEGNWSIERVDAPGQPVQASLISPNPMAFSLSERETRAVRFLFKVPGHGTADVGFTVDTGGWFKGTLNFYPMDPNSPDNALASLGGTNVPFMISWSTATVTRSTMGSDKALNVNAGPLTIQFGGPYSELLHDRIAPALQSVPLYFDIIAMNDGRLFFTGFNLEQFQGERFGLRMEAPMYFTGALDADGYPAPRPFNVEAPVTLRKMGFPGGAVSGMASMNASAE